MSVRKTCRAFPGVSPALPAGALALVGGMLLCLLAGQAQAQDAQQIITPPAAVQDQPPPGPALAAPLPGLPAQIFDTPKPGRWPGSAATPLVSDKPAQTAPQPGRPAGPATPTVPAKPAASVPAPTPSPAPAAEQPGGSGGIPLQVTIPPPGGASATPGTPGAPQGATTGPARPARPMPSPGSAPAAGSQPITLPAGVLAAPSGASPASPAATPAMPQAASPAATATPAAQPGRPAGNQGGTTAPAIRPPAPGALSGSSSSSNGTGQPDASSEVPRINFEGAAPAHPTPAPVTRPSSRPPAPSLGMVDMVMPGTLPELEPFDENSPEALSFDAGRDLGIRDDSTTPLQRFGDSIPNFTRDEMTARQQEDQQSFTYNRGPAGQMGN